MRAFKIILVLLAVIVTAVGVLFYFGPMGPRSPYWRFQSRDADYYSRLAHACDSLLQRHPNFVRHSEASSKEAGHAVIWMDANDVVWDQTRLTPSDPSLPDLVRALHPDEVLLAPNRVFIGFGVGRLAWAIIWEQDDTQTNRWTLQSNGDGLVKRVYAETR
jgi:hypothetical protein